MWHLSSEDGAVQVLVSARRFDRQKIENVMTQVTSRIIDEQERTLKATNARGDEEQAAVVEARIREVRRMDTSLALLLGITVDEETKVSRKRAKGEAWEWNPDWSLGYRANLAPLAASWASPLPGPHRRGDELPRRHRLGVSLARTALKAISSVTDRLRLRRHGPASPDLPPGGRRARPSDGSVCRRLPSDSSSG